MKHPVRLRIAIALVSFISFIVVPTVASAGSIPFAQYREFHANCTFSHFLSDNPITAFGQPGTTYNYTFIANTTTNAFSTYASLLDQPTTCQDPEDYAAYWFPTLYRYGVPIVPQRVTIYYKSGVKDYRTVQPFPPDFRLVVGNDENTSASTFGGNWSCGTGHFQDIPPSCPPGNVLIVRYKAPSCWDGINLDTPDHQSHMVYPVRGVCPSGHPIPLPMLEAKVPYKLPGGHTSGLAYSSGPSYTFHYGFINAWEQSRLVYLVHYCINGGRQCNGFGIDPHKP